MNNVTPLATEWSIGSDQRRNVEAVERLLWHHTASWAGLCKTRSLCWVKFTAEQHAWGSRPRLRGNFQPLTLQSFQHHGAWCGDVCDEAFPQKEQQSGPGNVVYYSTCLECVEYLQLHSNSPLLICLSPRASVRKCRALHKSYMRSN